MNHIIYGTVENVVLFTVKYILWKRNNDDNDPCFVPIKKKKEKRRHWLSVKMHSTKKCRFFFKLRTPNKKGFRWFCFFLFSFWQLWLMLNQSPLWIPIEWAHRINRRNIHLAFYFCKIVAIWSFMQTTLLYAFVIRI